MLNTATLMGRLTKDPELRFTKSEKAVCAFTLAVDRDMDRDNTDFISCLAWTKTAEFISKYFAKGSRICIQGRIQTRTWETDKGEKRYVTEVVADRCWFVDSKAADDPDYTHKPKLEEMPGDESDLPF